MNKDQRLNNFNLVKALEEVAPDKVDEVLSHPELDQKTLSGVLEDSMMDNIVNQNGDTVELKPSTVMAGIRNLINKVK